MPKHLVTIDNLIKDFETTKITGKQFKIWYNFMLTDPHSNREDIEYKTQEFLTKVAEAVEKSTINKNHLRHCQELLTAFKFELTPKEPNQPASQPQITEEKGSVTARINEAVSEKESLLPKQPSSKITQYGATENTVQKPKKSICAKLCEQFMACFAGQQR